MSVERRRKGRKATTRSAARIAGAWTSQSTSPQCSLCWPRLTSSGGECAWSRILMGGTVPTITATPAAENLAPFPT